MMNYLDIISVLHFLWHLCHNVMILVIEELKVLLKKTESHTSFLRLIIKISYNNGTVGLFQAVYTIAPIVVAGNVFASALKNWWSCEIFCSSWKSRKQWSKCKCSSFVDHDDMFQSLRNTNTHIEHRPSLLRAWNILDRLGTYHGWWCEALTPGIARSWYWLCKNEVFLSDYISVKK